MFSRWTSQELTETMSKSAYLQRPEITCPNCGADGFNMVGSIVYSHGFVPRTVTRRLVCVNCNQAFEETFTLTDMRWCK
jgi:DNA-directed RNA polymerase subunit RPC12/RpoP